AIFFLAFHSKTQHYLQSTILVTLASRPLCQTAFIVQASSLIPLGANSLCLIDEVPLLYAEQISLSQLTEHIQMGMYSVGTLTLPQGHERGIRANSRLRARLIRSLSVQARIESRASLPTNRLTHCKQH